VTTWYINASSAGGDGTTNNESGGTAAYASLVSWEANATPTTLTDAWEVLCDSGSSNVAETTNVLINAFTTTATNNITIKPNTGQFSYGIWNSNVYRFDTTSGRAIEINNQYVTVTSLQFKAATTSSFRYTIDISTIASGGSRIEISNCLVWGLPTGGASTVRGIYVNDPDATTYIINNIVFGYLNGTNACHGINIANGNHNVLNNTVTGCRVNISLGSGATRLCVNNIAQGGTLLDFESTGTAGSDFNLSSDTTATTVGGSNGINSTTLTFVNAAGDDYHLVSGDANNGSDLSGTFTDDIDGETRSDWHIGADEYIAVGGVTIPVLRRRQMMRNIA